MLVRHYRGAPMKNYMLVLLVLGLWLPVSAADTSNIPRPTGVYVLNDAANERAARAVYASGLTSAPAYQNAVTGHAIFIPIAKILPGITTWGQFNWQWGYVDTLVHAVATDSDRHTITANIDAVTTNCNRYTVAANIDAVTTDGYTYTANGYAVTANAHAVATDGYSYTADSNQHAIAADGYSYTADEYAAADAIPDIFLRSAAPRHVRC